MEGLSERDAMISAANVLMVALLKMNRVIVPAFLKWRRGARLRMIQKADRDMRRMAQKDQDRREKRENRNAKGKRQGRQPSSSREGNNTTSAGPVTNPSTSTQLIRISPKVIPSNTEEGLEPAATATTNTNVEAGQGANTEATDVIQPVSPERSPTGPTGEDEHLRKVRLEQLARAEQMHLMAYTSFATVVITIASIILYAGIIITLVLTLFSFGKGQALIFSFSLIATAMISESEVLLRKRKQSPTDTQDLAKFRFKTNSAHGKASTVSHHNGQVSITLDDIDQFSDMET